MSDQSEFHKIQHNDKINSSSGISPGERKNIYAGRLRGNPAGTRSYVRAGTQLGFFLLITAISLNTFLYDRNISSILPVSLHGFCPMGAVVSIYSMLTSGTPVRLVQHSSFIILSAVLLLSLLFGSVFCGWVCPLGAFQDFVARVTGKFHRKKYNKYFSGKIDMLLRHLRYIVLFIIIIMTAVSGHLMFALYDPYHALFSFWLGEAAVGGITVLLLLIVVTGLFVERSWCKYLCPYGALLGIFNKIKLFQLRRSSSSCINCRRCDRQCPMNIRVSVKNTVTDSQCISCLKCTSEEVCPVQNTVLLKNRITIKQKALSSLVLVVFTFSVSVILYQGHFIREPVRCDAHGDISDLSGSPHQEITSTAFPAKIAPIPEDNILLQQEETEIITKNTKYRDGVYEGIAFAYRPGFKLEITIENDKIVGIEIVSHNETRGYYEESFQIIPDLIIRTQSTDVDTISGATKTGVGIRKAVDNALNKAATGNYTN